MSLNGKNYSIWLVGLPGSGKTTLANKVIMSLREDGVNAFSLDGDILRCGLNSDLGFSESDRQENIRRVVELTKILTQNNIITIISVICPYEREREYIRRNFSQNEHSLVYLDCPITECESRDPKGMYSKARCGEITSFTGISDTFEVPKHPDVVIKTNEYTIDECSNMILNDIYNKFMGVNRGARV